MDRYCPRTVTLTHNTRNDSEALKELHFDLTLALREPLRPARLKEIVRKDPAKNPYPVRDDKTDYPDRIAAIVVKKIVSSHWFITRLPPPEPHGGPSPDWYLCQKERERTEREPKQATITNNN